MFKYLSKLHPDLPRKLRSARITDSPEYYVRKSFMTGLLLSLAFVMIAFGFLRSPLALLALLLQPLLYLYFLHYADMRILKLGREADGELVYAGRFLIIELEAGVPLYDTFQNVARQYPNTGRYFQEIVDKVHLGTSMEQSINEVIEYLPSDGLRKLLWQIINSLRTGSEIASSLKVAIEQVVREQRIQVVEYGRKLNPMAMFYMMVAVIIPSLGVTMIIIVATFIGFTLSLPVLLMLAGLLAFVQFMFLATIRSQRPSVVLS